MGWIYLVESEEFHSGSEITLSQLLIAKSTHIVKEYSYPEFPTDFSLMPQSGITSQHCLMIREHGHDVILSMEDFHVKTSVLQDLEKAWLESEADYFSRSLDCVAKLSQDLSFWKMSLPSLFEEEPRWLGKLPRWGMIVDGALYPLRPLEPSTKEKDGSLWLTPSTMEHLPVRSGDPLERALYRGNSKSKRKVSGRLNEQVSYPKMWPTPQARAQTDTPCLETQVKLFATPTASQANKPICNPSPSRMDGTHGEDLQDSIDPLNPESIGKKLCPRWVSLLMGYQTNWTDLGPLVMQWYLSKSKKRLKS